MKSKKYIFYTHPLAELSSVENSCLENDFPINDPVDFDRFNYSDKNQFSEYIRLIDMLGIENPGIKLNQETYNQIKERIYNDFNRLSACLINSNIGVNTTLFITIGNSMESYGFILHKLFPNLKIGHIKVSRTLKNNIEEFCGEDKKNKVFIEYFQQKVTNLIDKYQHVNKIIFIDTFGAGETTSTILHPFIHAGLKRYPDMQIFTACLLEAGHLKPTPPYDGNIKLIHYPQADTIKDSLNDFKSGKSERMPVLIFNEYIPSSLIDMAIGPSGQFKFNETIEKIRNRFRLKELKIFSDIQRIKLKGATDYIIVPGKTTRLLYPINPYITVAQKTVFLVKDIETGYFYNRDGFGFSRKEQPPMLLHRINNHPSFQNLRIKEKIALLLNSDKLNNSKTINYRFTDDDIELIEQSLESFLRKKVIYYMISKYECNG